MGIESIDGGYSAVSPSPSQEIQGKPVEIAVETAGIKNPDENKYTQQMNELEKGQLPVSEKVVIEAIEKANKAMLGANAELRFSVHSATKQILVKDVDKETGRLIREVTQEK